jgi:hypothetical protein
MAAATSNCAMKMKNAVSALCSFTPDPVLLSGRTYRTGLT